MMAFPDADQLAVAREVLAEANAEHQPSLVKTALMEAGLAESDMHNLDHGDSDSRGVFQERPSQGWHDVMNVRLATQQMIAHMDKTLTDPGAMAQSGERSAFPGRYNMRRADADKLLSLADGPGGGTFTGGGSTSAQASGVGAWGQDIINWITKYALKLALIIFGAAIILLGVWVALGHPPQDFPALGRTTHLGKPKPAST